jgi:hypothetical protein
MQDFMIHVEKIVRPVRAVQSRKLRMRRELLTHLQSAFDEERARGIDEPTAMESAKRRLGAPAQLTSSLQQSVPWIERTLLAKLKIPAAAERFEKTSAERIYGSDRPMTMGHMSILVFVAAVVSYGGLLMAVLVMQPQAMFIARFDHPVPLITLDLILLVLCLSSLFASARLIAAISKPGARVSAGRMMRFVIVVVGSPLIVVIATVTLGGARGPTALEIARGVIIGGVTLVPIIVSGRLLARLRKPYDAWLTLQIAE